MSDYMKEMERLLDAFGQYKWSAGVNAAGFSHRQERGDEEEAEEARAALLAHIERGRVGYECVSVPRWLVESYRNLTEVPRYKRMLDDILSGAPSAPEKTVAATVPVEKDASPTAGMNLWHRVEHVGGRTNAAGYVEFGSAFAVQALINQVLRDLRPVDPSEVLMPEPVAYLYTLEYGKTVANTKVSLWQLNYPFGVCGADYMARNDDGVSYVRQTPLYTAASSPAECDAQGWEWQPIKTAPTDGTRILLCGKGGKIADGHYGQPDGYANPKQHSLGR